MFKQYGYCFRCKATVAIYFQFGKMKCRICDNEVNRIYTNRKLNKKIFEAFKPSKK